MVLHLSEWEEDALRRLFNEEKYADMEKAYGVDRNTISRRMRLMRERHNVDTNTPLVARWYAHREVIQRRESDVPV